MRVGVVGEVDARGFEGGMLLTTPHPTLFGSPKIEGHTPLLLLQYPVGDNGGVGVVVGGGVVGVSSGSGGVVRVVMVAMVVVVSASSASSAFAALVVSALSTRARFRPDHAWRGIDPLWVVRSSPMLVGGPRCVHGRPVVGRVVIN